MTHLIAITASLFHARKKVITLQPLVSVANDLVRLIHSPASMPLIPQRQSLLGQTVTSIRTSITSGDWPDVLPSERALCDELQISRSTLRRALEKIQEEGLIEEGKPGRRRKITYTTSEPKISTSLPSKNRKVIWLTRLPLSELPSITLRLVAILQNMLSAQSCIVDVTRVPERVILNPDQHMKDWLAEYCADVYVLHWMPQNVQQWFQQHNPVCCILGSAGANINLPSIEVDTLAAMRHALATLQRQGHTKIGLVREESALVGEINIERILLENAPNNYIPSVAACPKDAYLTGEALERIWSRTTKRPSALICTLPHLALYTMSWLLQKNIKVPEDVSVVTLRTQPMLEYFTPSIAHYFLNEERAVSEMVPRLLDLLHHQTCSTTPINLTLDFIDGDSIAKKTSP